MLDALIQHPKVECLHASHCLCMRRTVCHRAGNPWNLRYPAPIALLLGLNGERHDMIIAQNAVKHKALSCI